ncbi:hypothetical protein HDU83_000409 [Entophlyctis luteolus]|nr:hypothetical protein HDU83_000409 [Entophlyctis luteolus]
MRGDRLEKVKVLTADLDAKVSVLLSEAAALRPVTAGALDASLHPEPLACSNIEPDPLLQQHDVPQDPHAQVSIFDRTRSELHIPEGAKQPIAATSNTSTAFAVRAKRSSIQHTHQWPKVKELVKTLESPSMATVASDARSRSSSSHRHGRHTSAPASDVAPVSPPNGRTKSLQTKFSKKDAIPVSPPSNASSIRTSSAPSGVSSKTSAINAVSVVASTVSAPPSTADPVPAGRPLVSHMHEFFLTKIHEQQRPEKPIASRSMSLSTPHSASSSVPSHLPVVSKLPSRPPNMKVARSKSQHTPKSYDAHVAPLEKGTQSNLEFNSLELEEYQSSSIPKTTSNINEILPSITDDELSANLRIPDLGSVLLQDAIQHLTDKNTPLNSADNIHTIANPSVMTVSTNEIMQNFQIDSPTSDHVPSSNFVSDPNDSLPGTQKTSFATFLTEITPSFLRRHLSTDKHSKEHTISESSGATGMSVESISGRDTVKNAADGTEARENNFHRGRRVSNWDDDIGESLIVYPIVAEEHSTNNGEIHANRKIRNSPENDLSESESAGGLGSQKVTSVIEDAVSTQGRFTEANALTVSKTTEIIFGDEVDLDLEDVKQKPNFSSELETDGSQSVVPVIENSALSPFSTVDVVSRISHDSDEKVEDNISCTEIVKLSASVDSPIDYLPDSLCSNQLLIEARVLQQTGISDGGIDSGDFHGGSNLSESEEISSAITVMGLPIISETVESVYENPAVESDRIESLVANSGASGLGHNSSTQENQHDGVGKIAKDQSDISLLVPLAPGEMREISDESGYLAAEAEVSVEVVRLSDLELMDKEERLLAEIAVESVKTPANVDADVEVVRLSDLEVMDKRYRRLSQLVALQDNVGGDSEGNESSLDMTISVLSADTDSSGDTNFRPADQRAKSLNGGDADVEVVSLNDLKAMDKRYRRLSQLVGRSDTLEKDGRDRISTSLENPDKQTAVSDVEVVSLNDLEVMDKRYRRMSEIINTLPQEHETQTGEASLRANPLLEQTIAAVSTDMILGASVEDTIGKKSPLVAASTMKTIFKRLFGISSSVPATATERTTLLTDEYAEERLQSAEAMGLGSESSHIGQKSTQLLQTTVDTANFSGNFSLDVTESLKPAGQKSSNGYLSDSASNISVELDPDFKWFDKGSEFSAESIGNELSKHIDPPPKPANPIRSKRSIQKLRGVINLIDSAIEESGGVVSETGSEFSDQRSVRSTPSYGSLRESAGSKLEVIGETQEESEPAGLVPEDFSSAPTLATEETFDVVSDDPKYLSAKPVKHRSSLFNVFTAPESGFESQAEILQKSESIVPTYASVLKSAVSDVSPTPNISDDSQSTTSASSSPKLPVRRKMKISRVKPGAIVEDSVDFGSSEIAKNMKASAITTEFGPYHSQASKQLLIEDDTVDGCLSSNATVRTVIPTVEDAKFEKPKTGDVEHQTYPEVSKMNGSGTDSRSFPADNGKVAQSAEHESSIQSSPEDDRPIGLLKSETGWLLQTIAEPQPSTAVPVAQLDLQSIWLRDPANVTSNSSCSTLSESEAPSNSPIVSVIPEEMSMKLTHLQPTKQGEADSTLSKATSFFQNLLRRNSHFAHPALPSGAVAFQETIVVSEANTIAVNKAGSEREFEGPQRTVVQDSSVHAGESEQNSVTETAFAKAKAKECNESIIVEAESTSLSQKRSHVIDADKKEAIFPVEVSQEIDGSCEKLENLACSPSSESKTVEQARQNASSLTVVIADTIHPSEMATTSDENAEAESYSGKTPLIGKMPGSEMSDLSKIEILKEAPGQQPITDTEHSLRSVTNGLDGATLVVDTSNVESIDSSLREGRVKRLLSFTFLSAHDTSGSKHDTTDERTLEMREKMHFPVGMDAIENEHSNVGVSVIEATIHLEETEFNFQNTDTITMQPESAFSIENEGASRIMTLNAIAEVDSSTTFAISPKIDAIEEFMGEGKAAANGFLGSHIDDCNSERFRLEPTKRVSEPKSALTSSVDDAEALVQEDRAIELESLLSTDKPDTVFDIVRALVIVIFIFYLLRQMFGWLLWSLVHAVWEHVDMLVIVNILLPVAFFAIVFKSMGNSA